MAHPLPEPPGLHNYDLLDELAALDSLAATGPSHEERRNDTVMVGQGTLVLDGGQPDLFDEDNWTGSPSLPVDPPPEAEPEPSRGDPLSLRELSGLARALMDEHGLVDWSFAWDRAVRRAGATKWRTRTISLSAPLMRLFPSHEARNTILHEIAHALAGQGEGHGDAWRAKATEIGARPQRCYDSTMPSVEGDWVGTCPAGHTIDRHRAPKHVVTSCGTCAPRVFDHRYVRMWFWRGVPILSAGRLVELIGDHPWRDQRGTVSKVLDTQYVVQLESGATLHVPFALVAVPDNNLDM